MQRLWRATPQQLLLHTGHFRRSLSHILGSGGVARLQPRLLSRCVRSCTSGIRPTAVPADFPAHSSLTCRQEYRRNVGICLVNKTGLVFAARRVDDTQGTWQMPQGGIDLLENPFVAAARELMEETGIRSITFIAQIDEWLEYEFPTIVKCSLTGTWTRYKGQTQKWLLYRFSGEESEINLDHADREFLEYKWTELEELPKEVVSFKQHVYECVFQQFAPYIQQIKLGPAGL